MYRHPATPATSGETSRPTTTRAHAARTVLALAAAALAACNDTTAPSASARAVPPSAARPALAVGANTIVFERDTTGDQAFIYTMNDDGTNVTRLATGVAPAWSPDHSMIVFVRDNTIFIMNADGTGARKLTGVASDRFPSFTADGAKVLFTHANAKGGSEVLTVNLDGTNRQLFYKMGNVSIEAPRMSPDGTKLAFHAARRNDSDIIVVDLATGRRTVVAGGEFRETFPAWSPDSKRLAYLTGLLNNASCLAVVNADGTGQKGLTNDVDFCNSVSWSPDGKEVAFTSISTEAGVAGIYRAPVDVETPPTRLTTPLGKARDAMLSWTR